MSDMMNSLKRANMHANMPYTMREHESKRKLVNKCLRNMQNQILTNVVSLSELKEEADNLHENLEEMPKRKLMREEIRFIPLTDLKKYGFPKPTAKKFRRLIAKVKRKVIEAEESITNK